jgi:dolichyl-diphosphooligosaccharide---protein glycosyltransferase
MVWYPLGRPVGTTIYPGMQVTAVWIKNHVLNTMSINDICCYIPAWFGALATAAVAWLAYECTRESTLVTAPNGTTSTFGCILQNIPGVAQVYQHLIQPLVSLLLVLLEKVSGKNALGIAPRRQSRLTAPACAVAAAMVMSVVPAHLLRSVAGGYDNESIAMTAMVMTFATWTFSLRDNVSLPHTLLAAVVCGLAYFYMVAAWGGYVFVLNVVGVHAVSLVLLGRYSTKLHRAYTIFYVVGTSLAIQVPVVGWTPLKSLEQLGPALAFGCFQLIEFCEYFKRRDRLTATQVWKLRIQVFAAAAVVGVAAVAILAPTGYFGPISSRVRGLFVKHTKTGNPLVDSVAEHQAASPQAYLMYLHELVYLSPVAWAATGLFFCNDASSFLIVYGLAAYFFSHRMVRLILLTAPIASVLGGIFIGRLSAWALQGTLELLEALAELGSDSMASKPKPIEEDVDDSTDAKKKASGSAKTAKVAGKKKKDSSSLGTSQQSKIPSIVRLVILAARLAAATFAFRKALPMAQDFHSKAHLVAQQISHPTIIQKGQSKDGEMVMLDDYREAYWWLRDNTPEDARVMAWWDCTLFEK